MFARGLSAVTTSSSLGPEKPDNSYVLCSRLLFCHAAKPVCVGVGYM